MISAVLALDKFQQIAAESHSPICKNLLEKFLVDIRRGQVYALGADGDDVSAIFVDRHCTIYGYLLTQARPRRRPAYQVSLGLCPGDASLQVWAFFAGVAKFVATDCASHEQLELYSIPVLGSVRVSMLMTIINNQYQPIFIIPRDLSPIQGLAALYRAIVDNETRIGQQLISHREVTH